LLLYDNGHLTRDELNALTGLSLVLLKKRLFYLPSLRYGAIWLHFAVRQKDNRRKILFVNA
jgi:hypothetical protein